MHHKTICIDDLTPEQLAAHKAASSSAKLFAPVARKTNDCTLIDRYTLLKQKEPANVHVVRFSFTSPNHLKGDMHLDMRLLNSMDNLVRHFQQHGFLPHQPILVVSDSAINRAYEGSRLGAKATTLPEHSVKPETEAKKINYIKCSTDHFELHFCTTVNQAYLSKLTKCFEKLKAETSLANHETATPRARL